MWSPTDYLINRAHSSENFCAMLQKEFCNTILRKRTSPHRLCQFEKSQPGGSLLQLTFALSLTAYTIGAGYALW